MRQSVSCSGPIPTQVCVPVGATSREVSPMSQHAATPPENRSPAWAGSFFHCLLIAATILILHVAVYAREPARMEVRTLPECEVFDANPDFIDSLLAKCLYEDDWGFTFAPHDLNVPYSIYYPSRYLYGKSLGHSLFYHKLHERVGAVADGESRLLLKKQVPFGHVSWRVTGETGLQHGTCEPLFHGWAVQSLWDNKHYAFAVYTPPEGFGKKALEVLVDEQAVPLPLKHRTVLVEITWEEASVEEFKFNKLVRNEEGKKRVQNVDTKELLLERPPVVLVHGTYDNASECWAWNRTDKHFLKAPPAYRTENLRSQLKSRGFSVYLVNYRTQNGTVIDPAEALTTPPGALGSHFRDNEKVVWDGGRPGDPLQGEGIAAALENFRNRGIAATQADVVGHSMGGVLIRVYAKGSHLPAPNDEARYQPWSREYSRQYWYKRRNNFNRGDINRIITIGSTHMGSHMSGLLQHYAYFGVAEPLDGEEKTPPNPIPAATLRSANYWSWAHGSGSVIYALGNMFSGQFPRGAFTDQIPGSKALMAVGPTPVPAHAIACVATPADLDLFKGIEGKKGLYRTKMELVWDYTPRWFLVEMFRRLGQSEDAAELAAIMREIRNTKDKLARAAAPMVRIKLYGGPVTPAQEELFRQSSEQARGISNLLARSEEKGKRRLMAAVFGNDYTDYTVSLSSQLGGLPNDCTTIIPKHYQSATNGVLHSYEPRHKDVQKRVIELLMGGMASFCEEGLPDIKDLPGGGKPCYYRPSDPRAFQPYGHLP